MMSLIYGKARRVLVWLGEESELEDGRKMFEIARAVAPSTTDEDVYTMLDELWPRMFNERRSPSVQAVRLPAAASRFFDRPWFGRRWIIQELFCAKDVAVLCGQETISWTSLRVAIIAMCVMLGAPDWARVARTRAPETVQNALYLCTYQGSDSHREHCDDFDFSRPDPLLAALMVFSGFERKNDRDRIYALLYIQESLWAVSPQRASIFPRTSDLFFGYCGNAFYRASSHP